MSSNRTDNVASQSSSSRSRLAVLASSSVVRLVLTAAGTGVATWAGASLLSTTTRAGQDPVESRRQQVDAHAAQGATTTDSAAPGSLEERMRRRRAELIVSEGWDKLSTGAPGERERRGAAASAPSNEEWRAAAEAMRPHSPNAVRRVERSRVELPARARMMRALVDRHRELERIKKREPEQYKREIEQIELEDQILGASRQLARADDMAGAYELKVQIKDMVTRLVDMRIANREARLARLAATVDAERKRLDEEKGNRQRMIDRQMAVVARQAGGGGTGQRRPGSGPADPASPAPAVEGLAAPPPGK